MDIKEVLSHFPEARFCNPQDIKLIIDAAEFNRENWHSLSTEISKDNETWHLVVQTLFVFKRISISEGLRYWMILIANLRKTLEESVAEKERDETKFEKQIEKIHKKIRKIYGEGKTLDYRMINCDEVINNSSAIQYLIQNSKDEINNFDIALELLEKITSCVEDLIHALMAFEKRIEATGLLITMSNTLSGLLKKL